MHRDDLSQDAIKNDERDLNDGTNSALSMFVIDNRHPHPTHIRDLLLLAATDAADERSADASVLADLDIVDVVAVAAILVHGQLQALTAGIRSAEDRSMTATEVFTLAQSMVADPRSVGAVGTVVGAVGQGDRATAAAIARCLGVFDADELADAAVALCAANLLLLSRSCGVSVTGIVSWAVADQDEPRPVRAARPLFCTRDALDIPQRTGAPRG